jgi:hypothetical protein
MIVGLRVPSPKLFDEFTWNFMLVFISEVKPVSLIVVRNPWLFMEPELSCSKLKKKHTIQKIIT